MRNSMSLSIVIPVLNEASSIVPFLKTLAGLRARGAQLIVVDGGSSDGTPALAAPLADMLVNAKVALGDALLFLHADTTLPPNADQLIASALADRQWGRFDVRFEGPHPTMRMIAAMMNLRSRITGVATGDQAMFVRRDTFSALAGFAPIPLMEDIELSRRLRRICLPACLRQCVTTSHRRWKKHGVWRTVFLMWRLRLAYFFGADPRKLAIAYGYHISE